ncbi:hypothetical protein HPB48_020946 [Haemaphysalis longicornis]|uniref:Uncharacterized protein n=1 Tax=Haemaphysalis longicornis TaxID=44386 RepID=A0A9J6G1A7_HAELO|nr:hypothetical protein HPB48_020946 [Haemaphysalis longicornis]
MLTRESERAYPPSFSPRIQEPPYPPLLVAASTKGGFGTKNDSAPFVLAPMLVFLCKLQPLLALSPSQQRLFRSRTVRKPGFLQTPAFCRRRHFQRQLVTDFTRIQKGVCDNCRNNEFILDVLSDPWSARPLGIRNPSFVAKGTNYLAHRGLRSARPLAYDSLRQPLQEKSRY